MDKSVNEDELKHWEDNTHDLDYNSDFGHSSDSNGGVNECDYLSVGGKQKQEQLDWGHKLAFLQEVIGELPVQHKKLDKLMVYTAMEFMGFNLSDNTIFHDIYNGLKDKEGDDSQRVEDENDEATTVVSLEVDELDKLDYGGYDNKAARSYLVDASTFIKFLAQVDCTRRGVADKGTGGNKWKLYQIFERSVQMRVQYEKNKRLEIALLLIKSQLLW